MIDMLFFTLVRFGARLTLKLRARLRLTPSLSLGLKLRFGLRLSTYAVTGVGDTIRSGSGFQSWLSLRSRLWLGLG